MWLIQDVEEHTTPISINILFLLSVMEIIHLFQIIENVEENKEKINVNQKKDVTNMIDKRHQVIYIKNEIMNYFELMYKILYDPEYYLTMEI